MADGKCKFYIVSVYLSCLPILHLTALPSSLHSLHNKTHLCHPKFSLRTQCTNNVSCSSSCPPASPCRETVQAPGLGSRMCVEFNSVTTSKRGCEGAPHEHRYQSNFTHVSAWDENVCLAAKSCGERMQTSADSGVGSSSKSSRETDITIYYMPHRWNLLDTSQKKR
jgi:hypothetical protein